MHSTASTCINTVPKESWWFRARRSHVGIASVVAFTLFVDMLSYGVVVPILPTLIIKKLKGDSAMVGFLFGCYAFGLLFATPLSAILSDKYQNRRVPMLAGTFGLVVSTLFFAAAETYTLLVIARVAQGVAGGTSWAIGYGFVADVFPAKYLGMVMGVLSLAYTVGLTMGPVIGGYLYEFNSYSAPFLCCTGLAVLNFFAILWVVEPSHDKHNTKGKAKYTDVNDDDENNINGEEEEERKSSNIQSLGQCSSMEGKGTIVPTSASPTERTPLIENRTSKAVKQETSINIWTLCKNWKILRCVLCTLVSSTVFSGFEPTLPIYLENVYDASASVVGFVFIFMVIPAFLSPLIGHLSDKIGRYGIVISGMILNGIALPLAAIHYSNIYLIIPSLLLVGLANSTIMTPIQPAMGEVVNDLGGSAYAQVYALFNMAYSGGMLIGPIIAGVIMHYGGFGVLMIVFSITLVACSPLMMDWNKLLK